MGKRDNGIAEQKQLIERRYIYEFKKHEKNDWAKLDLAGTACNVRRPDHFHKDVPDRPEFHEHPDNGIDYRHYCGGRNVVYLVEGHRPFPRLGGCADLLYFRIPGAAVCLWRKPSVPQSA